MPDKRPYCGSGCLRCWRNRMKHGNKLKKNQGGTTRVRAKDILKNKETTRKEKLKQAERSDFITRHEPKYIFKPWKITVKEKQEILGETIYQHYRICQSVK